VTFYDEISFYLWFYLKDESGILKDNLCIFEQQKMHVYFQNGSDFHIQLPFMVRFIHNTKETFIFIYFNRKY
jgi:hypothetical protein